VHNIRYKCESKRNGCREGLNLKGKTGHGERKNLRQSRGGEHTKTKLMILFTFNIPSYFEETRVVGKGSAKRIQCVAVMTLGLDTGQSDMSDPIILWCDEGNGLTI